MLAKSRTQNVLYVNMQSMIRVFMSVSVRLSVLRKAILPLNIMCSFVMAA